MAQIVIDGYNLLAKMGGMAGSLESRREWMVRLLDRFRIGRGHAITVVFDGERGDWPAESYSRMLGVDIVFSRTGEKADHVIKRMAEDFSGELVVISSDREVASYAETCGHIAIRSEDFMKRLRPRVSDVEPMDDEDSRPGWTSTQKKGNPKKLSKEARRRAQKLHSL
ncbi:MAG: NYN domain-containing protein [Nitrospirae bacterium]|nr:NYN domain-containing protein [Nitrospirota bacterium]